VEVKRTFFLGGGGVDRKGLKEENRRSQ